MRIARFLEVNRLVEGGRREHRTFLLPIEWGRRAMETHAWRFALRMGLAGEERTGVGVAGGRWSSGTPLF